MYVHIIYSSVNIQELNSGVPAVENIPNQPGNTTGPLDSLLNFGRSFTNNFQLLKTFSTMGTTGGFFFIKNVHN